jgi:hypothetical protein
MPSRLVENIIAVMLAAPDHVAVNAMRGDRGIDHHGLHLKVRRGGRPLHRNAGLAEGDR